jgi:linoleoyl-CoA desaturase
MPATAAPRTGSLSLESPRVRFTKRDESRFLAESKARTAAYFAELGRSDKADARMVLKTVVILATAIGSYAAIMSNRFSAWEMLGLSVLLGLAIAGMGFSIAHDALHGAYSHHPIVNRLLGLSFDLVGANSYMWKITHNVIHHTYTNINGVDEDLSVSPLLRLSPDAEHRWFHRYQHLYGFAAYGLATLNWFFVKDYWQFSKRELGPYRDKRHARSAWITLVLTKLFCVVYMIVLPWLLLDVAWWQVGIGFLVMHLVAGITLGVIFQLAHIAEGVAFPQPASDGQMAEQWAIHQMQTTTDFAHGNRVLSWFIGGLNYQVEHHLFPQVCSVHYPAIAKIVAEVAAETGVPYHYTPTLRAAIGSHYRMLKQLGQPNPAS